MVPALLDSRSSLQLLKLSATLSLGLGITVGKEGLSLALRLEDFDAQGKFRQAPGGLVRLCTLDPERKGLGLPPYLLVSKTTRAAACFCSPRDLEWAKLCSSATQATWGVGCGPATQLPTSFVAMGSAVAVT